ncbi:MAG: glutaminyl-peptide cyclotransferase [Prolixibacteraceae bacterium]|jgi:glutaminyl-peptide cyclotransferase|nr:glutaminyl-peptide cyclotransferase [Prolixibacteraceae bacterium]MDI9562909.1 glutaminyl-peptide cyclotransferase [Bacteroidota bacterium]NLS99844.1 glutaminyl-peptide cyclotransferase [Bacteroidales bacterium]HNZ67908.1 glutaminyl-peptide cyclotransferase [Prolixibacteraceae bacterium]HOC85268.1 glutaminyl-peptide cyclotransferase [Prolixibacteraceae bacterium]
MNKCALSVVVVVLSLIFICSCAGKSRRPSKPVITVELTPSSGPLVVGKSLTVSVKSKVREGTLKKTDLYLNNRLLVTETSGEFSYTITELQETGVNTLRVFSEKNDGSSAVVIRNFTLLSDVVPVNYSYTVIRDFPHDTGHFTQGLEIRNGFLFEGTGEYGTSAIYRKNLPSGRVVNSVKMDNRYFGEGITILEDKIYQLTYKNQIGFVYNLADFALVDSFRYASKEGWGLTNDGKSLIMSDGSAVLTWIDPAGFSVQRSIQVADHEKIYQYLNELEYDSGYLWANVWGSERILRIEARSGRITGYVDLKGLLGTLPLNQSDRLDVMNGIALMPSTGHLLVTGKRWPRMFEIKVIISE